ncbi:MAG: TusE/DsrC/DsvC family sulfur relay protein [Deltaproteobacteria bacterium]|nr:MAG: TusE/DsrC/DsvC family sulfur relay protein [Deltaproteobacteria bacterium]
MELMMQTQEWQTAVTELSQRMDKMNQQLAVLVQSQTYLSEMMAEMSPILKEVMSAGTTQLQELEDKGYFAFAREMTGVLDQIVTGFSPDDVQQLGQNVVGILNTVKGLTQPDMLNLINEATEPIHHPENVKPVGMYGMMKATRDDDVRRGFGVMVEVLRQVGRGVQGLRGGSSSTSLVAQKSNKRDAVRARLAPKRRMSQPVEAAPAPAAAPARPAPRQAAVPAAAPAMEGFSADGYLLNPETWNRDMGAQIAQSLGIELTEEHWKVVDFARSDYLEVGKSPNIRRITQGMDVKTKDIYALFPQAPGRTISKVAGIPKPGGCL